MILPTIIKTLSDGFAPRSGILAKTSGSSAVQARTGALFTLLNLGCLASGRLPGQLIIQLTDGCNASCAQCGMRRENEFTRSTLAVDDVKKLLDAAAAKRIAAVSFTGGEPLLYLDMLIECVQYAKSLGIRYIRTGTNGFLFRAHERQGFTDKMHRLAESLARSGLYTFWISIDSASERIHERNRGLPGTCQGIAKALPVFHEHGLFPSANLSINWELGGAGPASEIRDARSATAVYHYFQDGFRRFYRQVESLGFTIVNACYPMDMDDTSEEAVFTATSESDFVRFTPEEKQLLFQAMFDVIPEFRGRLRVFTPRSALRTLIEKYQGNSDAGYACRGGIDFFFVDAQEMNTYPCGFRGQENMGKFWDIDLKQLGGESWCKQCDWECFRDPSELLGPLLDVSQRPASLLRRLVHDREYARLWFEDLRYYRACGYFDTGKPPDVDKLRRFVR